MTVAGKKIVVIEKDYQGKPDVGKSLLAAAYGDDKADIAVGPSSSGVALALLPVADGQSRVKVESVYCLGLCSVGPAALVGEVVQARLNAASFAALLGAA